jgi:competence protein ComEA
MKMFTIIALSASLLFSALSLHAEPVNINTADAKTISTSLKGIGIVKAQAVIDYRNEHGSFTNINNLSMVKGIGDKTIEKNKKDILL